MAQEAKGECRVKSPEQIATEIVMLTDRPNWHPTAPLIDEIAKALQAERAEVERLKALNATGALAHQMIVQGCEKLQAELDEAARLLRNLHRCSTASDFNEHWESYKEADEWLSRHAANGQKPDNTIPCNPIQGNNPQPD